MAFNGNVSFRIGISACKFLPLVELKCEIQGQVDVSMWSDDYFSVQQNVLETSSPRFASLKHVVVVMVV